MYRFLFLLLALAPPRGEAFAQAEGAKFSFRETAHDFGIVAQDTAIQYRFDFVNTGGTLLVINDISLSCPCFEVDWIRGPVLPGDTGWVEVRYPTGTKAGPFDKLMWITSNAVNNAAGLEKYELRIFGAVSAGRHKTSGDSVPQSGIMLKSKQIPVRHRLRKRHM